MGIRSYADVIGRIERMRDLPARAESYDRFKAALDEFIRIEAITIDPSRVIVVAGTNGKGSTCKALETLLIDAGESVGLFTSPHLIRTTERIRCRGSDLNEAEFVVAFEVIELLADRFGLSHFETLTLMACATFFTDRVRSRASYAIFEAGVGGRFDPVNAIPHFGAVITRLGLDHCDLLGQTLAEIAWHKFGVVRPDGFVVSGPGAAELAGIERPASQWIEASQVSVRTEAGIDGEPRFIIRTPWGSALSSLPGRRSAENIALALTTFEHLGFDPARGLASLERIEWPARMETFVGGRLPCPLHLSGDHNPQGVESLVELLGSYFYRRLHLVIGVGARKDLEGMMSACARIPRREFNLTRTTFRPAPLESYASWLERAVDHDEDPLTLLDRVVTRARSGDRIVVSGSLYLAGTVRGALLSGRFGELAAGR